jgi:predicted HicB family RNase H-like nuclease
MTDKRRTLRANAPRGNLPKMVQTRVDPVTYARLYMLAERKDVSLSDLIREALENLVGTR